MVSSIIYGIGVLIIGIIIYFFDLFATANANADGMGVKKSEIFNMYLCVVGTAWLLWLMFDIQNYVNKMKNYYQNGMDETSDFRLVEGKFHF